MDNIKAKIQNIIDQTEILKDIQKDDKIYYYDNMMYYHSPSTYQSIYRTVTGETREYTFKYLEQFIANYINTKRLIDKNYKFLDTTLIEEFNKTKNLIFRIFDVLNETYPDNKSEINNLLNFFSGSL
jgi:hypothetical protein